MKESGTAINWASKGSQAALSTSSTRVASTGTGSSFGGSSIAQLQKELTDKICWSVGSTLRLSYGRRTKLYHWALGLAGYLVESYFSGIAPADRPPEYHPADDPRPIV